MAIAALDTKKDGQDRHLNESANRCQKVDQIKIFREKKDKHFLLRGR